MTRLHTPPGRQPARHHEKPGTESGNRSRWALIGFIAIGAFFVLAEHKAHVMGALPYILLLLCPLLHLFHHRGHGGNDRQGGHAHHKRIDSSDDTGSKP